MGPGGHDRTVDLALESRRDGALYGALATDPDGGLIS
jgi:hypothetical protein